MRNAGNPYLKYTVFRSIKRWYVLPVYISIETNRKYLLWCPERRTGVLPSILKTLQEVQGGIKSKNGRLSSMDNFWQQTLQAFPLMWASKQKYFLCWLTRMRTSRTTNKRVPLRILSHWLRLLIYQLGFWTPKWGRPIIIRQTGKMCHKQAVISMTQILNIHRGNQKWIFLSFLLTNKQKQNKFPFEVILHVRVIFSTFIPFSSPEPPWGLSTRSKRLWGHRTEVLDFRTSGQFRFESKLENSLLKALNHLFTVIDTSARASERY